MPRYAATLIFDRRSKDHWVNRDVRLICAPGAEEAYERAIAIGNAPGHFFEFVGLDDLVELGERQPGDGDSVWYQSVIGLPASDFVHPKEEMSVFDDSRGWSVFKPDRHDLK